MATLSFPFILHQGNVVFALWDLDGIEEVSTELPDHTVCKYLLTNFQILTLQNSIESDPAQVDFNTQVTHTCLIA